MREEGVVWVESPDGPFAICTSAMTSTRKGRAASPERTREKSS